MELTPHNYQEDSSHEHRSRKIPPQIQTHLDTKMNVKMYDETAISSVRPSSPRSTFIKKKFPKFDPKNELVLDNFACAFNSPKILLQGMLYLTDKCCYFYSPFNEKTLVGQGSKIQIQFTELRSVKKESSMFIFPNAIRFIYKSGEQILFKSFLSRDTCFSFILSLMT